MVGPTLFRAVLLFLKAVPRPLGRKRSFEERLVWFCGTQNNIPFLNYSNRNRRKEIWKGWPTRGADTRAFSLGAPRAPRRRLGASRPGPKANPPVKPLVGPPYLYRRELMLYGHRPTEAVSTGHICPFSLALIRLTSSRHRFRHLISCHAIRSTEPGSVLISCDHVRE